MSETRATRADSHIHLFQHGFSTAEDPGAELATYLSLRERYGIDEALVVGYEGHPQFAGNNEYILALAMTHSWIHPTLFLDPQRPPTPSEIESDRARGAVGYSLYLGADPELTAAIPRETWDALSHTRSILSVNATPEAVSGAEPRFRDADGACVLLSHLGLPGDLAQASASEIQQRIAPISRLADAPNVSVKLSGLYATDPDFPHTAGTHVARELIAAFGPRRTLWGSDYAPGLSVLSEPALFALPGPIRDDLTEDELESVLGGALRAVLAGART